MKRFLSLLLVIAVALFACAGCAQNESSASQPASESQKESSSESSSDSSEESSEESESSVPAPLTGTVSTDGSTSMEKVIG